MKQKLIDLSAQRATHLTAAENALTANDTAAYDAAMEKVGNLNGEITRIQNLLTEQNRQIAQQQPTPAEARDAAEERGHQLLTGGQVTLTTNEIMNGLFRGVNNSVTLAEETLLQPTGSDSRIRDVRGSHVSAILDQVSTIDLTGLGSFLVPYAKSETVADSGAVKTLAGTERPESSYPTFAYAEIKPYEVNVTQYVDRNLRRLTEAAYFDFVKGKALTAMRRKVAELIIKGDGQASNDMYGILTAKNKQGDKIYAELSLDGLDEATLDELYYAYGTDEEVGESAHLYLPKEVLKVLGGLRNDHLERIYKISHTGPNVGSINDSGSVIPYAISKDLKPSGSGATLIYGDPANYLLGLFGGYSIRIDESYKAASRMDTILGDVMVGGNLTVDKGMVVATVTDLAPTALTAATQSAKTAKAAKA